MIKAFNPELERELTSPITYLKGEYSLHKYSIPYFSVVLPMSFIAKNFTLIDEIPNSERIEWTLQELFQRDIAWERVDEGLVKYLQNESIQQFFNSLTVALLPKEGHGLADKYNTSKHIEKLGNDHEEPVQVGGCSVQPFLGSKGLAGRILWDKNEIAPVAVDGQHRLAAIKELIKKIPPEKLNTTYVPVILILPHTNVGYTSPVKSSESVFASLRKIFIDLNQNAKPVSRARNILLNDSDIVSVCTRSLIGSKLSTEKEKDRIYLGLVDWVSEKNKFESGPFITTLLILNDIVSNFLDFHKFKEPESEYDNRIKTWIKDVFFADDTLVEDIMNQARYCYNQEVPLTFTPEQLNALEQCFVVNWRPWIYRIFTELEPYEDLIDHVETNNLHSPELVNLYIEKFIHEGDRANTRASEIKDAIKQKNSNWNIKSGFEEPINIIDSQLKENNWFYKVVFQRALFDSYLTLYRQMSSLGISRGPRAETMKSYSNLWINAINKLVESGFADLDSSPAGLKGLFWSGIALNSERKIEYTKVGSNRIEHWLNAWVCMYYLNSTEDGIPSFKQLSILNNNTCEVLKNSITNRKVKSGMSKVVAAKNDELSEQEIEAKVTEEIVQRYNCMRKIISKLDT